ncbi:MAG: glycoside hydrolase family 13 protein [Clostridia bacterium]|nr:glycoside hydrolase family 13 protein [Clostridia bacterium]
MIEILYNSKSKKHKIPFGALKTEESALFNLYIKSDEDIKAVNLIYREDDSEISNKLALKCFAQQDNYMIFTGEISFKFAGLYFYRFEIETDSGVKFVGLKDGEAKLEDWLPEWQLTVYDKNFKTPEWAKDAVMYQIFPDRFARSDKFSPLPAKNERKIHNNWYDIPEFIYNNPDYKANDYFCGNIDGIIEKLGYIKLLGVNIIYLNPIFESPEYHRYSTGNYMNVDPYFGTNEQFEKLCLECNKLGIKVVLDGVFSHTGADSLYFNRYSNYDTVGAYNSENSPYKNWYNFIEYPEKYECWWGFDNLPNVDEKNPEYLNYITGKNGVIEYWQSLGASGWRLDVADELPDEFLDSLYKTSKNKDKESFIIGEVWEDATNKFAYDVRRRYLLGSQMDSVMNYPWRTAILEFVKNGDEKLFNDRIMSIMENYPSEVIHCLMNSLSTHDTIRAITYFGVEHEIPDEKKGEYTMTPDEYNKGKTMLMQATFLQFTLPGIASIYYGDEVGLYGFRDPYCRMAYPYGKEDVSLLEFFRKISKVRNEYKEDFKSKFELCDLIDGFYSFKRGNLVCAINLGEEPRYISGAKKEAVLSFGKTESSEQETILYPGAFVILK